MAKRQKWPQNPNLSPYSIRQAADKVNKDAAYAMKRKNKKRPPERSFFRLFYQGQTDA
jgi:hypothetical protein